MHSLYTACQHAQIVPILQKPPLLEMQIFIPRLTKSEILDEVWDLHFYHLSRLHYMCRNLRLTYLRGKISRPSD